MIRNDVNLKQISTIYDTNIALYKILLKFTRGVINDDKIYYTNCLKLILRHARQHNILDLNGHYMDHIYNGYNNPLVYIVINNLPIYVFDIFIEYGADLKKATVIQGGKEFNILDLACLYNKFDYIIRIINLNFDQINTPLYIDFINDNFIKGNKSKDLLKHYIPSKFTSSEEFIEYIKVLKNLQSI